MRRTRHVALPVRAWRYVGLLIVSLACLTLGLVSRDKEGRAGSLAGPELEHRAPHEVDACPNLGPFTKVPSCSNLEQGQSMVLKTSDDEARSFGTRLVRTDNGMPRSRSLDRLSRDFRSAERLSRQGTTGIIGARDQDRAARRVSLDLNDAGSLEGRIDRRKNREDLGRKATTERRARTSRLDYRFDVRDRTGSRSVERREATSDRRVARGNRVQVRGRRSRSVERREKRDSIREDRPRSRMDNRRVEVRDSRVYPGEARRNVRSVVDEGRNSRYAAAYRDQDGRSVRSMENARQMGSRSSRSSERTTVISRAGRQASRSLDRENSRVTERRRDVSGRLRSRAREASRERESLARSRTARSTDSRRERNDDTLRNSGRRDSRLDLDRRSSARLERRVVLSERRERMSRLDRSLDARSIERRDSSLARRERTTSRLNLAREARESRIRLATDLSSDRRSERRNYHWVVDSGRSSERRSTMISMSPNREQVRADRRQTEQRIDSRQSNRQRLVDAKRLQRARATGPANGVRLSREQRLTDRIHLSLAHSDSAAQLSRVPSANARLFASRAKIPGVSGILSQEHSIKDGLTFQVIRQAIVIGLCAVYGLSMFQGKRSFIRNVVRQAPRFFVW